MLRWTLHRCLLKGLAALLVTRGCEGPPSNSRLKVLHVVLWLQQLSFYSLHHFCFSPTVDELCYTVFMFSCFSVSICFIVLQFIAVASFPPLSGSRKVLHCVHSHSNFSLLHLITVSSAGLSSPTCRHLLDDRLETRRLSCRYFTLAARICQGHHVPTWTSYGKAGPQTRICRKIGCPGKLFFPFPACGAAGRGRSSAAEDKLTPRA